MAIELPALIQKVRVDVSEMSKAENAARKLGSSFDDLDVSAGKAEKGISGVRRENERSTPVTKKHNSELGVMIGKFRDAGKHGAVLGTVISTLKIPAMAYAVKLATGAVADLGAGLVGLVGAMAPAAGAVAALPAAYLAVGSSVGVLKVATSGSLEAAKAISKYGAASKQAQEALKGLGPEARKFTVELGLMQKQWEGVTKATQAATLPGLTQALKNLQPLVPIISKAMAQTGASLAGVAIEGSRMMASGPFSKDLASIGTANAKVVGTLGSALLQMVSALRHLMVAAAPLTQWLADSVLAGAKWVNSVTAQGRASGRLAGFFERTRTVLSQLGRILRDTGAGLVNLFSIGGKNLGQPLLDGLERIMARFREFTSSTEGKTQAGRLLHRSPASAAGARTAARRTERGVRPVRHVGGRGADARHDHDQAGARVRGPGQHGLRPDGPRTDPGGRGVPAVPGDALVLPDDRGHRGLLEDGHRDREPGRPRPDARHVPGHADRTEDRDQGTVVRVQRHRDHQPGQGARRHGRRPGRWASKGLAGFIQGMRGASAGDDPGQQVRRDVLRAGGEDRQSLGGCRA